MCHIFSPIYTQGLPVKMYSFNVQITNKHDTVQILNLELTLIEKEPQTNDYMNTNLKPKKRVKKKFQTIKESYHFKSHKQ